MTEPISDGDSGGRSPNAIRWLVRFFLQFLLPILAIGPIMMFGEEAVHALGLPVTDSQFVRLLLFAYYGVLILVMVKRGKTP